ncbi:MAG: hypothetical protein M5U08_01890 [Burkholderiales bacterium]|nr:hypothetical protein [Burkholderiales bacterium]
MRPKRACTAAIWPRAKLRSPVSPPTTSRRSVSTAISPPSGSSAATRSTPSSWG